LRAALIIQHGVFLARAAGSRHEDCPSNATCPPVLAFLLTKRYRRCCGSALTDTSDQMEGLSDAFSGIRSSASSGDHFICNKPRDGASASAFSTNASTAYVAESVNSPWCSEFFPDDAVGLAPIRDGQNMSPTSTQEQDFDWDYWEHRLSQPVGSIPEFESVEGSSSRQECMLELPPLEVILDRCGADVLVKCLPDFTLDELLAFRSKMRHPPATEEIIEAHKLFATCI